MTEAKLPAVGLLAALGLLALLAVMVASAAHAPPRPASKEPAWPGNEDSVRHNLFDRRRRAI